jgi:hypothetical protein
MPPRLAASRSFSRSRARAAAVGSPALNRSISFVTDTRLSGSEAMDWAIPRTFAYASTTVILAISPVPNCHSERARVTLMAAPLPPMSFLLGAETRGYHTLEPSSGFSASVDPRQLVLGLRVRGTGASKVTLGRDHPNGAAAFCWHPRSVRLRAHGRPFRRASLGGSRSRSPRGAAREADPNDRISAARGRVAPLLRGRAAALTIVNAIEELQRDRQRCPSLIDVFNVPRIGCGERLPLRTPALDATPPQGGRMRSRLLSA